MLQHLFVTFVLQIVWHAVLALVIVSLALRVIIWSKGRWPHLIVSLAALLAIISSLKYVNYASFLVLHVHLHLNAWLAWQGHIFMLMLPLAYFLVLVIPTLIAFQFLVKVALLHVPVANHQLIAYLVSISSILIMEIALASVLRNTIVIIH